MISICEPSIHDISYALYLYVIADFEHFSGREGLTKDVCIVGIIFFAALPITRNVYYCCSILYNFKNITIEKLNL